MVDFPPEAFFKSTLAPGTIYYFVNEEIQFSDEPHYHVIVSITENEKLLLTITTSQTEKKIKYIEKKKLPYETLVFIKPDEENGLTKESAVNCNECYLVDLDYLRNKYDTDDIQVKGKVKQSILEQIIKGLLASPLIEEEIKERLKPNIL